MIINKYKMTVAQLNALQKEEEYHVFLAESKRLSEKDLKILCVFAPCKVLYADGTYKIYTLSDVQFELDEKAFWREHFAKFETHSAFRKMLEQSEVLQNLWKSADNVLTFIDNARAWISANNDFEIEINEETYTRHYFDLRQSGEYIDVRSVWNRYKGQSQHSTSAYYEETLLTLARSVMLLDFYITNNIPCDDHPSRYTDEESNQTYVVIPVSACHPSVADMMY